MTTVAVPDLLGTSPANERAPFGLFGYVDTFEAVTHPGVAEAIGRAGRAREARDAGDISAYADIMIEATRRKDWKTLGYRSFKEYIGGELLTLNVSPPARRHKPGRDTRAVYFIQARDGGPIKIGVAHDPHDRLRQIEVGSPVPLILLGTIPGVGQSGERELHARFAGARRRGEWFEPVPELLAYIAGLASGGAR